MSEHFESHQIKGAGRGKVLGFPTINLYIPSTLTIPYGIYAARIEMEGNLFFGALHFGAIPTFDSVQPSLEVFLIDANEALIPSFPAPSVQVEIVRFIRPVVKFDSVEALKLQIAEDVKAIREALATA